MIGRLAAWYRENVSESADCMACRLISGFGMMGIGAFVLAQAKRRKSPIEKFTMQSIAACGYTAKTKFATHYTTCFHTVAGFLGVARIADANFLKAKAEPIKEAKPTRDHAFFKR